MAVTINKEQRLYVFSSGNGYSCYGFDVLDYKIKRMAQELNISPDKLPKRKGTYKAYGLYHKLVEQLRKRYNDTGQRSTSGLNPKLIGLEGKRVEVVYTHSDKPERFYVSKSGGWIPSHIEIKLKTSIGGGGISSNPDDIKSVRVLDKTRF